MEHGETILILSVADTTSCDITTEWVHSDTGTMVTIQIHQTLGALPRMGLGLAALGRPGYINLDRSLIFGTDNERTVETMQSAANAVIDTLFENCGNSGDQRPWLDCARSYGLSEKFVGEYLRSKNIPPSSVYVSSKWGYSKLKLLLSQKTDEKQKDPRLLG